MEFSKDTSFRSVFVSNIPYEVNDDKLKEILGEVGHIVSFRMIMDSETSKPKGFAFCEFEDSGIANSAIRNLNGREICGRNLRIAPASTKDDLKTGKISGSIMGIESNLFGPVVHPENAPEEITKAVASLPPEQMFELMKQMKLFIMHQPEEARQLLLHNPQLPYALLQAQVVMRIVDPRLAHEFLHKPSINVPNYSEGSENMSAVDMKDLDLYHSEFGLLTQKNLPDSHFEYRQQGCSPLGSYLTNPESLHMLKSTHYPLQKVSGPGNPICPEISMHPHQRTDEVQTHLTPQDPRTVQEIKIPSIISQERSGYNVINPNRQSHSIHSNPETLVGIPRTSMYAEHSMRSTFHDNFDSNMSSDLNTHSLPRTDSTSNIVLPIPNNPYKQHSLQLPGNSYDPPHDPRRVISHGDPQTSVSGVEFRPPIGFHANQHFNISDLKPGAVIADKGTNISSISQEEKTSLILQVLALTDDQIAQLTVEQRHSIILLKEQIAKQTGAAIQART